MKWEDFRGKFLGPTDPAQAPAGSLRNLIYKDRSPKLQQAWTFKSLVNPKP